MMVGSVVVTVIACVLLGWLLVYIVGTVYVTAPFAWPWERRAAKVRSTRAAVAPCKCAVWPLYVPRQSSETVDSTFDDEAF